MLYFSLWKCINHIKSSTDLCHQIIFSLFLNSLLYWCDVFDDAVCVYVQHIAHKHYWFHYFWFRIKICLSNSPFLSNAIIFCLPLHIRSMLLEFRFLWMSSWSWWYFWFFIAFWHISTLKYNFSPVPEAELTEVVLQLHSVICVLTMTFMVYL